MGGGWQSGIKRWNTPMPHHRFFGHKRNASFAQALTPQCRTAWLRHRSEGSNTIRLKPTKTEAMMRIEMGGKMRERERERREDDMSSRRREREKRERKKGRRKKTKQKHRH